MLRIVCMLPALPRPEEEEELFIQEVLVETIQNRQLMTVKQ